MTHQWLAREVVPDALDLLLRLEETDEVRRLVADAPAREERADETARTLRGTLVVGAVAGATGSGAFLSGGASTFGGWCLAVAAACALVAGYLAVLRVALLRTPVRSRLVVVLERQGSWGGWPLALVLKALTAARDDVQTVRFAEASGRVSKYGLRPPFDAYRPGTIGVLHTHLRGMVRFVPIGDVEGDLARDRERFGDRLAARARGG